ncbi:MAG TPA: hypothetical protein VF789_25085 [Thermoanaerobaculia bacterium]
MRRVAPLAVLVFFAAAALSAKAAFDLTGDRAMFPSWFVPAFVAGLAALVAYAAFVTLGIWRARGIARLGENGLVWVLLPLSLVCTSAVHQFYPFRPSVTQVWGGIDQVLRLNLVLTGAGFLAAVSLALLYRSGLRERAVLGLLVLDLLLLVPNDACANPFNTWWIDTVGASPLMFVPVLYASLFGIAALLGIHPRWNTAALAAACLGVTLLGLGHMTRVIW